MKATMLIVIIHLSSCIFNASAHRLRMPNSPRYTNCNRVTVHCNGCLAMPGCKQLAFKHETTSNGGSNFQLARIDKLQRLKKNQRQIGDRSVAD
jgi:hypothetical protein